MGDISIRESIRWLPDPPSEPTSTIVLTSPERRFVDIRILKPPGQQPGASVSDESPNIPLSRLDWAISGNSSSEQRVHPSTGEKYSHCEWRHWISSRTVDTENATDEGDNYSVEGNPSLTLEKGRMMNPQTGRVTEYEEVWRSGEILPCQSLGGSTTTAAAAAAAARDDGDAKRPQALCLVLQYQGDESDGKVRRGTVIRLGRWCQAFARIGDDLVVERWEWADEEGKTGWEKKVVISADKGIEMPTEFAMMVGQEEGVSVEDEVVCGANGERWVVVEKSSC